MDTQSTGTSTEETLSGDSSIGTTDETATSDTSEADAHEDAATLKKQLSDKDRYIKQLEAERVDPKKKSVKREAEDQDDVMTWMTLNTDNLKVVGKEFQEELAFYKAHNIPVTNDIRDRALRDAKARKGFQSSETQRQASTSSEVTGEMRKTGTAALTEEYERAKKYSPNLTMENFKKHKAELDSRKRV